MYLKQVHVHSLYELVLWDSSLTSEESSFFIAVSCSICCRSFAFDETRRYVQMSTHKGNMHTPLLFLCTSHKKCTCVQLYMHMHVHVHVCQCSCIKAWVVPTTQCRTCTLYMYMYMYAYSVQEGHWKVRHKVELTFSLTHYHTKWLISLLYFFECFLHSNRRMYSVGIIYTPVITVYLTLKASFSFLNCSNALSLFSTSFWSWAIRGRSSATTDEGDCVHVDCREREWERERERERERVIVNL